MNPGEWPIWVQILFGALAGSGPLGAGFGFVARSYINKEKAHHATRDAHEKRVETMATDFAHKLDDKDRDHRKQMQEQDIEHRKQMHELLQRCMAMIEQQSKAGTELLDSLRRRKG